MSILQHVKSLPLIFFGLIMKEIPFREASQYTLLCGEPRFSERILLMRQAPLTYRVTTAFVTPQRSSRESLLLRNKGRIFCGMHSVPNDNVFLYKQLDSLIQ